MSSPSTVNEVKLKRLRAKFSEKVSERPASVSDVDWAVFNACVQEKRALSEVSKTLGLTKTRLRGTLARVEAQMDGDAALTRPLEDLQLSVRARNALHRLGCQTVEDVFRVDFSRAVRQVGSKTRTEVLEKLEEHGFRQPATPGPSPTEVSRIARSLDRVQTRVNTAFEGVRREIRVLQERLKKLGESRA